MVLKPRQLFKEKRKDRPINRHYDYGCQPYGKERSAQAPYRRVVLCLCDVLLRLPLQNDSCERDARINSLRLRWSLRVDELIICEHYTSPYSIFQYIAVEAFSVELERGADHVMDPRRDVLSIPVWAESGIRKNFLNPLMDEFAGYFKLLSVAYCCNGGVLCWLLCSEGC